MNIVKPHTTEIVYTYPNGEVKVKYIADYGSPKAIRLMDQVNMLRKGTRYFYRHI